MIRSYDPTGIFRFVPLTGPVQVHHVHYKCTVYYEQNVRVGWPIPYTMEKKDAQEVVYIDKDHLHAVQQTPDGGVSPMIQ